MKRGSGSTAVQKNDKGKVKDIKKASKGSWEVKMLHVLGSITAVKNTDCAVA